MKLVWSSIKSVMSMKKLCNVNVISKLKEKNDITSHPVVIANLFNKYFVNISQDITKHLKFWKIALIQ